MNKRVISLTIIFLIMLFNLTGCAKKEAISIEKFNEIVKNQDCSVEENLEYYDKFIDIIAGSKAKYSDKWEMNFYVLSGNKDAELMFEKDRNILESYKKNVSKLQIETTMPSYELYEIVASEHFGYVCRIDNTVLYVDAEEQYKDEIKAVIEELGY